MLQVVNEVLSDAAVLKRQAHEIEELRKMLAGSGCAWTPPIHCLLLLADKVVASARKPQGTCWWPCCKARPSGDTLLMLHNMLMGTAKALLNGCAAWSACAQ